jgi:hypothetical protein
LKPLYGKFLLGIWLKVDFATSEKFIINPFTGCIQPASQNVALNFFIPLDQPQTLRTILKIA